MYLLYTYVLFLIFFLIRLSPDQRLLEIDCVCVFSCEYVCACVSVSVRSDVDVYYLTSVSSSIKNLHVIYKTYFDK